jgi:hypothetical protein
MKKFEKVASGGKRDPENKGGQKGQINNRIGKLKARGTQSIQNHTSPKVHHFTFVKGPGDKKSLNS